MKLMALPHLHGDPHRADVHDYRLELAQDPDALTPGDVTVNLTLVCDDVPARALVLEAPHHDNAADPGEPDWAWLRGAVKLGCEIAENDLRAGRLTFDADLAPYRVRPEAEEIELRAAGEKRAPFKLHQTVHEFLAC